MLLKSMSCPVMSDCEEKKSDPLEAPKEKVTKKNEKRKNRFAFYLLLRSSERERKVKNQHTPVKLIRQNRKNTKLIFPNSKIFFLKTKTLKGYLILQ